MQGKVRITGTSQGPEQDRILREAAYTLGIGIVTSRLAQEAKSAQTWRSWFS